MKMGNQKRRLLLTPMKQLLSLTIILLSTLTVLAQEVPVKFTVVGSKGEPIGAATVTVVAATDSTTTQTKMADSAGRVSFQLQQNNFYKVLVSSVNYEPL